MSQSLSLATPFQYVKGVGPRFAVAFQKLGVVTVRDFFYFFPRTFDDRRRLPKVIQLKIGVSQGVLVRVKAAFENQTPLQKKSILRALLHDETGGIVGVWFNQSFLKSRLKNGQLVYVYGKVEINAFTGERQLLVQDTEWIMSKQDLVHSVGKVIPVYPLTQGVTQSKCRELAAQIIPQSGRLLVDAFPSLLLRDYQLMPVSEAVSAMHFPRDESTYRQARRRLAFEEFFYFQLVMLLKRGRLKQLASSRVLQLEGPLVDQYIQSLGYSLTAAQQRVIGDIESDIASGTCMNRLIQGDVGAGKTDVAIITLLFAVQSGLKGALLAPTEILAHQHYVKCQALLSPLGVTIVMLKGKMKAKARREALALLSQPGPLILVGTHALIEEGVQLSGLGVVVVDEQHRFGVQQRAVLQQKGDHPHCLYMTATPIPRSLTLTYYGDLMRSVIDELPPGRIPPKTHFVESQDRHKPYEFAKTQIEKGFQVYLVFPLVEESEKLDLKAAIDEYERLSTTVFKSYTCALIHGRLSPDEKQSVMTAFKQGHVHVLVSTTVIEVGVDVPNATTMIIHHAERFGLSALHQLRGRIGRGSDQSFCFLIGQPRTESAKARIKAMVTTHDGFELAQIDLRLRGPGDLLGNRQSGMPELKVANLLTDEAILLEARDAAHAVLMRDSGLQQAAHRGIRGHLMTHFKDALKGQLN